MMKGRGKEEGYWKEGWVNGKSFGQRIGQKDEKVRWKKE